MAKDAQVWELVKMSQLVQGLEVRGKVLLLRLALPYIQYGAA
jgi:hypothetical protein